MHAAGMMHMLDAGQFLTERVMRVIMMVGIKREISIGGAAKQLKIGGVAGDAFWMA